MVFHLVITIDELWLKGKNRGDYLRKAIDHINAVFRVYHQEKFSYKIQAEKLYFTSKKDYSQELISALGYVPGLAALAPCFILDRNPNEDLENLYNEILNKIESLEKRPLTFKPEVKRVDKKISMTSVNIAREIGHRVITRFPELKVNLKNAELVIDIRILPRHTTIHFLTQKGVGGLPWGSSGSAVTLLSGGFDSPVASFLMAKRGVRQSFVFFHAYPFVGREVVTKIKSLVKELAKFQKQTHLYIVPFGEIQNLISKECREEYRTLFFRRYMIELANLICDKTKAQAIVTGDSIGQVASQTMENLQLMDKASRRIILRPLVGFNKLEIINTAKIIGTHDISILPHDDACSLFASKNPIINPDLEYWINWDKDFNIEHQLQDVISRTEVFSVNIQGEFYKKDYFSYDG